MFNFDGLFLAIFLIGVSLGAAILAVAWFLANHLSISVRWV
jgi:hypothetical protein